MDGPTIVANGDAIVPGQLRVGNEQAARALSVDACEYFVSIDDGLEVPAMTHSVNLHVDERVQEWTRALADAARIIADGLAQDDPVFVHCYEGRERAPTVAATALARHRGLPFDRILGIVKEQRPITVPTPHLRAAGQRVVNGAIDQ